MTTGHDIGRPEQIASPDAHRRVDGDWLASLARHYAPALTRFFERRMACKADSADLVQDVFLRLSRMQSTETIQKPEHYLFKIASNVLRDHYRHKAVRQAYASEFIATHDDHDQISPSDIVEAREALREVERILRLMPERTRDIFVLRVFDGRTSGDIALSLGISTRAVEKHYAKALARIARTLRAYRG